MGCQTDSDGRPCLPCEFCQFASLGHLLMAQQHCHLCLNGCFSLPTAPLAYHVSCASLGHLLMAQHCHLCMNACFTLPTAPHLPHCPPPRHPLPTHPSPIDSIRDITAVKKKLPPKPGAFNYLGEIAMKY